MYLTTAADAQKSLDDLIGSLSGRVAVNPARVTDYANGIQEMRGIVDVITVWERHCADSADYFGENPVALLIDKQEWLAKMALTAPEDTWSGRGNDGRRSFHDGRMKVLQSIRDHLIGESRALIAAAR